MHFFLCNCIQTSFFRLKQNVMRRPDENDSPKTKIHSTGEVANTLHIYKSIWWYVSSIQPAPRTPQIMPPFNPIHLPSHTSPFPPIPTYQNTQPVK